MESNTWDDIRIEEEIKKVSTSIGSFPSCSELRSLGRNDLACAITRHGGFLSWSERLGIPRKHSDSDTGWDGEILIKSMLEHKGIVCSRTKEVKSPYDLLADSVLRIDVKSARFAEYRTAKSVSSGWFYRLGKSVQADLVVLYKLDTKGFAAIPWWECPTGNITLSTNGGKYAKYIDNWTIIEDMISARKAERVSFS